MDRDLGIERPDRDLDRGSPAPQHDRELGENRVRREVRCGRQIYSVNPDQRQTLFDIGRFRVIAARDLESLGYVGKQGHMQQDLRSLAVQGLVQKKSVWTGKSGEVLEFWTITKPGKRFLKTQYPVPAGQALYTGFVKSAELRHDAAIYAVYHRESALIERAGGRVTRVVLDYELKKKAYSPLAKAKTLQPAEYAKRQAEIAQANGLRIVKDHIVFPDLRIEYIDRSGVAGAVDLEVASESYHGSHAAEKAAAGFKIYASPEVAARLSRALEEREITADILWI